MYLPNNASPTPSPITIDSIKPAWNVLLAIQCQCCTYEEQMATYITANMNKKPNKASMDAINPRGKSCAGMKGREVRESGFLGADWPSVDRAFARLAISINALQHPVSSSPIAR